MRHTHLGMLLSRFRDALGTGLLDQFVHGGDKALAAFERKPLGAYEFLLEERFEHLRLGQLLESYSYERVLDRGFALVRDEAGTPVTRAADIRSGDKLSLRFADGERGATADGEAAPSQPQSKRKTKTATEQGTLI